MPEELHVAGKAPRQLATLTDALENSDSQARELKTISMRAFGPARGTIVLSSAATTILNSIANGGESFLLFGVCRWSRVRQISIIDILIS
eukprot:1363970-Amorphochlora_amoeboformis.AAC.2